MSSHSFSGSGETSVGAYACDEENDNNFFGDDATLRIGSCFDGRGSATWRMKAGGEIKFNVAWQNGAANVYIDGSFLGQITGAPGVPGTPCTDHTFSLPPTGQTFQVTVIDATTGCGGDIQIASVCVEGGSSMFLHHFSFVVLFALYISKR